MTLADYSSETGVGDHYPWGWDPTPWVLFGEGGNVCSSCPGSGPDDHGVGLRTSGVGRRVWVSTRREGRLRGGSCSSRTGGCPGETGLGCPGPSLPWGEVGGRHGGLTLRHLFRVPCTALPPPVFLAGTGRPYPEVSGTG